MKKEDKKRKEKVNSKRIIIYVAFLLMLIYLIYAVYLLVKEPTNKVTIEKPVCIEKQNGIRRNGYKQRESSHEKNHRQPISV